MYYIPPMRLLMPTNHIVLTYDNYVTWFDSLIKKPNVIAKTTTGELLNKDNWDRLDISKLANDLCCFHEIGNDIDGEYHILSIVIGRTFVIDDKEYYDKLEINTGSDAYLMSSKNVRKI